MASNKRGVEVRKWMDAVPSSCRVLARRFLKFEFPRLWYDYQNNLWRSLMRAYSHKFGDSLEYVGTNEDTKAGAPHIHAVMPERVVDRAGGHGAFRDWIQSQWARLVGDVSTREQQVAANVSTPDGWMQHANGVSRGRTYRTLRERIDYALKYVIKTADTWNGQGVKGLRRYRSSAGFEVPIRGCERSFEYVDAETGGRRCRGSLPA